MMNLTLHRVDAIQEVVKEWDNENGKYQSVDLQFLDADGEIVFEVTVFSDGEKFNEVGGE